MRTNIVVSETLNMVLEHFISYFRDSESTDCKLLLETVIANKLQLLQYLVSWYVYDSETSLYS